MADIQALEQRFEGISVQDENVDSNTAPVVHHKPKVDSQHRKMSRHHH